MVFLHAPIFFEITFQSLIPVKQRNHTFTLLVMKMFWKEKREEDSRVLRRMKILPRFCHCNNFNRFAASCNNNKKRLAES